MLKIALDLHDALDFDSVHFFDKFCDDTSQDTAFRRFRRVKLIRDLQRGGLIYTGYLLAVTAHQLKAKVAFEGAIVALERSGRVHKVRVGGPGAGGAFVTIIEVVPLFAGERDTSSVF